MQQKILYGSVDFEKIKSENLIAVDLHSHTKYSDGLNRVETMLKRAKKLGIGLAITDHNEILGFRYAEQLIKTKPEYEGILLIPGIEVSTNKGDDFLIYFSKSEELVQFYTKEVKPYRLKRYLFTGTSIQIEDMLNATKNYDCIVIAAHPFVIKGFFSVQRENTFELDNLFDGYEVINSGVPNFGNFRIQRYITHKDNPIITAGSDAHSSMILGTAVTCIPKKENMTPKIFLDTLREKKHVVMGKTVKTTQLTVNHMFFYNFILNKIKKTRIFKRITN